MPMGVSATSCKMCRQRCCTINLLAALLFLRAVSSARDARNGDEHVQAAAVSSGHKRAVASVVVADVHGIKENVGHVKEHANSSVHTVKTTTSETNLKGTSLLPCTQSDEQPTGVARSDSCTWDDADTGYHQVCVTMSSDFLESSKTKDSNDLSSVVSAGGHWCICAWAWASAVKRDPQKFEHLHLDCKRTNGRLREVYEKYISAGEGLQSPSGNKYPAQAALDAVNNLCGSGYTLVGRPVLWTVFSLLVCFWY